LNADEKICECGHVMRMHGHMFGCAVEGCNCVPTMEVSDVGNRYDGPKEDELHQM
jgi:hypothetical protein